METLFQAADAAVREGCNILVLSDRGISSRKARSPPCWRWPACTTT
jgi:hypothetical protein